MSAFNEVSPRVVTLPGLHGSDIAHWQSWLESEFPDSIRVTQKDWNTPTLEVWTRAAIAVFSRLQHPHVAVAHSFGCLAAVQALQSDFTNVVGLLLVAPASPGKFNIRSLNRKTLKTRSVVVASNTDPWMSANEARALAQDWGSSYINLGDAGHINVESGYGSFDYAKQLVNILFANGIPVS